MHIDEHFCKYARVNQKASLHLYIYPWSDVTVGSLKKNNTKICLKEKKKKKKKHW